MKSLNRYILRTIIRSRVMLVAAAIIIGGIVGFIGTRAAGLSNTGVNSTGCGQAICVDLKPDGITPSELAVKVGDFVQFNSADGQRHNLAEGDGAINHEGQVDSFHHDHTGGFVSGEFGANEAWRVQFKKAGTYKLHDHYNPKQSILVVVYEPSGR